MNVRIQYTLDFTAGIYYNNTVSMNNYTLRLWMITNTQNLANQNIAFARLKYYVYSVLDSTIFINSSEIEQQQRLIDAGLKVTNLPGDPVDQLIGIMLYYKLNAIMEDQITVIETEISSTLGESLVYLHSDQENSDLINYPAWWVDPGPSCYDGAVTDQEKIVAIHHSSAWRELELGWPDAEVSASEDNKVVFADFKKDDSK